MSSTNIIGLDVGRNGVKAYTGTSMFTFPSVVGEGRQRKLATNYGDDGFEAVFRGEHYFVGALAENESDFCRRMLTDDKAHDDTLILALVALHRAGLTSATVVTGLPVAQHDDDNKQRLRNLLVGTHGITVDGQPRTIRIQDVKVAVEGGAAFWSAPADGLVRLIDAGGKTVNYVTMRGRRYVDRDSGTLPFGFNTNKTDNIAQMAARIAGELGRKWSADDTVFVSGGRAVELAQHLARHFPQTKPIKQPLYANAIGYYKVGRATL